MGNYSTYWEDDTRVAILKKLWLEGLSASQIAKQLGGCTRNAVIGKVHRLGLSGRAEPSQPHRTSFPKSRPARSSSRSLAAPRRTAPVVPPILSDEEPGSATVLTLGKHMCKWPIGDPNSDNFSFCGRRIDGGSYCVGHARVAYQSQQSARGGRPRANVDGLYRSLRRFI